MIMCSPGNRFRLCWRFLSHSEGPGESTDTGSKMGTGIKRTIRRLCIEIPRPTLTVDVILINALFLPHHTLNTLVHPTGMLTHTLSHHLQLPLSEVQQTFHPHRLSADQLGTTVRRILPPQFFTHCEIEHRPRFHTT